MNASNKRPIESFIVASSDTAMPTSGTLMNTTTGAVNLANGQLGLISASVHGSVAMNSFVDATPTLTEAPVLAFVQGTSNSANPAVAATYPLWTRAYEQSTPIDGRANVVITKQVYREPSNSVWVVGAPIAGAGAVNVLENTEYEIAIGFRGHRIQGMHSNEQSAYLRASVTTPDFSDLSMDTGEGVDWILTKLAWEINRNSSAFSVSNRFPGKSPVVALLIDTTGTTGTAIGGVDPIVAGDVISVVTTAGGLKNITLTDALANSIKAAALAAQGGVIADLDWTIITVDLASAGTATGGLADSMLLIGLDETTSFVDWIPQVKTRLEVSLPNGFDYTSVRNREYSFADEGQGTSRQLDLLYRATQGQRKYNLRHTEWPVIEFPSPIVSGTKYNVYNISHTKWNQIDTHNMVDSPFREIVCIPTTFATLAVDAQLNSWLATSPGNKAIITLN